MHWVSILAAATLFVSAQCISAQEAEQEPSIPLAVTEAVDQHFLTFQEEEHIPGMSWGIVQNGNLIDVGLSGIQDLESCTPVIAEGALWGTFSWLCETGAIQGHVLLSPTNPPAIQSMRLRAVPAE